MREIVFSGTESERWSAVGRRERVSCRSTLLWLVLLLVGGNAMADPEPRIVLRSDPYPNYIFSVLAMVSAGAAPDSVPGVGSLFSGEEKKLLEENRDLLAFGNGAYGPLIPLLSVDELGFPNTKAMLPPRKRKGLKYFYFTTNTSSLRVQQYLAADKACLYFFNERLFQGLMIVGRMEVLTDKESKFLIWRDGDELYYPGGVTDPDYCVLKFTGEHLRTYQNFQKDSIVL